MDAVAFLDKVRKIDTIIKNKLIECEQWRALAMVVTANYEGERVQSSGNPQKMSDAIAKCVDMQKEIDALIEQLVQAKKEVLEVIEQLDPDEYDVLHMRYIQNMTNNDVAESKGYGASWGSTMHTRACASVQKILDGRGK